MACLWLRKCAGLHEQVAAAQRAEVGGCKQAGRALRTPVGSAAAIPGGGRRAEGVRRPSRCLGQIRGRVKGWGVRLPEGQLVEGRERWRTVLGYFSDCGGWAGRQEERTCLRSGCASEACLKGTGVLERGRGPKAGTEARWSKVAVGVAFRRAAWPKGPLGDSNPRLQGRLRPERCALDRSAILTACRGALRFACLGAGALGRCVPCATDGSRGGSRHRVNATGWLWRGRPGVPTPDPKGPRSAGRPCTSPPPRLRRLYPRRARAHQVLGAAAWRFRPRLFLPARSQRWRQQTGRTGRFHATRTRSCRGPAPDPGGIAGCFVGCQVRSRHRWWVASGRLRWRMTGRGRARAGPLRSVGGRDQGRARRPRSEWGLASRWPSPSSSLV
ncbi:uncharacterized protein LOC144580121 [Callithrix jacchus]